MSACTLEENERNYYPAGRIARVVCAGKEGTRKIITGIDGHTVHGQTLRARRLMEIVPGHGKIRINYVLGANGGELYTWKFLKILRMSLPVRV